jgi:hypothetical protein
MSLRGFCMFSKLTLSAAVVFLVTSCPSPAQTLTPLVNQLPDGIQLSFLLTDGTVMAQDYVHNERWWKLAPDINGSYVNGTWSRLPNLSYAPLYFASAVLADGRVLVEGGEYNGPNTNFTLTNQGAIYDPPCDCWTVVQPPENVDHIGDSPSVVLPNGKFLMGPKLTEQVTEFDPKTMTWIKINATGKSDFNAEEGWTLLPNGTVITADVKNAPNSEIYTPSTKKWATAGSTIVDLHSPSPDGCIPYPPDGDCYYPPGEIGPAILRPDGTVFFTGSYTNNNVNSSGNTAIYDTLTGNWTMGPVFPTTDGFGDNAGDSFAVLLPDGNVLVEGDSGLGYEFDGTNFSLTTSTNTYLGSLLVLPTGEVLAGGFPSAFVAGYPTQTYTSSGTYQASWAPTISGIESRQLVRGSTYRISGTQFNGLSQACAFGDEEQCSENYPLVRITNNTTNHVFYARTHDHSTMGVATGSQHVWTYFDVPPRLENGASTVVVVANGIPSASVSVTVY